MPAKSTTADDLASLRALNESYIRSVADSDADWFDRHLSADFLNSNPDCSIVDRSGFLAQIAKPIAVSGLRCEDVNIRLFGDMSIIHARTVYKKPDGSVGADRNTDIWSRQGGRWVCVAAHVARE